MTKDNRYKARHLPHFDPNKIVTGPYDSRKDKRICVYVRDKVTGEGVLQKDMVKDTLGKFLIDN